MVGERPEWLPKGWKMEVKTGEDGVIEKVASRVKDSNEWLPTGWIVKIKTRKSGPRAGENYKCYIDPATGSRFNSKRKVFQYISAGISASDEKGCIAVNYDDSILTSSDQNRSMGVNITRMVETQIDHSPKGLPQGWIKEIRIRKNCSRGHQDKKDTYYIEPETGYRFRSLKDVSRYIENGELAKRVRRLKEKHINATHCMKIESPLCTASRELETRGSTVRRCLFSEEIPKTIASKEIVIGSPSEKLQMVPVDNISGLGGSRTGCHHPTKLDYLEAKNVEEMEVQNKLHPAHDGEGIQGEELEHGKEKSVVSVNENELDEFHGNIQNNESLQPEDVSEKSSPPKESRLAMTVQKQNAVVRRRGRPRKYQIGSAPGSSQPNTANKMKIDSVKAIIMPLRSSKRLAGIKAAPVAITNVSGPTGRARARWSKKLKASPAKDKFSGESNATPIIIDLELPQEVKVNEGPSGENIAMGNFNEKTPGCSVKLPFGESWPDPCIEFAFRTLIGDIPPLGDSGAILDYFREKLNTTQGPSRSVYLQ